MREIIAEELRRELARHRFDYSEDEIEIKLVEDLDDTDFAGLFIEGGKKGRHIRTPLYFAEQLVAEGKAEWTESPYIDISKLYSFLTIEQRQPALQPIEPHTHISIAEQLHGDQPKGDQSAPEFRNSEQENMLTGFRRFLRNRAHKITRMASQRSHRALAAKTLTTYELVLFDFVTIVVEEWEKQLLEPPVSTK